MNTKVRVTGQHKQARELVGLSVDLIINQTNCMAGGLIKGKILMYVPQTGAYDLSGIHVSLVGYETVVVHKALSFAAKSSVREVVRINTEVVQLPSLLKAGQVEYPFCWQLPADKILPITMSCSKNASSCHVKYNLTAYLSSRKNSETTKQEPAIFSNSKPICVIGSGNKITDNNKYFDDDTTINQEPRISGVRSWRKHKGCIELGIEASTSVVSPNSMIAVAITGGNLSSVPVNKLLIQWVETVQWGRTDTEEEECLHRRVLAETAVAVNNAPQWQAQNNHNTKEYTESTAGGESGTTHAMKTMRYLALNNTARDSYEGHLIQVKHSINVMAITRGHFVTNAEFTAPMQVYRKQPRQPQYGACVQGNTPIVMAKAELSPFTANNAESILDNSNDHDNQEDLIRSDIEIPHAVPVSGHVHHGLGCPMVNRGEMEQHPPSCCSTESTVVYSGSTSSSHIMLSRQEMLEPALVLAVIE